MKCQHPHSALEGTINVYKSVNSARIFPVIMAEVSVKCSECGQRMVQTNDVALATFPWYPPLGEGPGTFLKNKLAESGYSGCDSCYELALYMNHRGPGWCIENANVLADDILPRAKASIEKKHGEWVSKLTGLLKLDGLADAALRAAIIRAIIHAVEEWKAFCESDTLKAQVIMER